ncbi:hypothetical protein HC776_02915 [bacterium]|nr:hypothetical protein [bacterium]
MRVLEALLVSFRKASVGAGGVSVGGSFGLKLNKSKLAVQESISLAKSRAFVGRTIEVLVDGASDETEHLLEARHETGVVQQRDRPVRRVLAGVTRDNLADPAQAFRACGMRIEGYREVRRRQVGEGDDGRACAARIVKRRFKITFLQKAEPGSHIEAAENPAAGEMFGC